MWENNMATIRLGRDTWLGAENICLAYEIN